MHLEKNCTLKMTGTTEPFWQFGTKQLIFGQLKQSTEVDVCIIGAGISGLTTGYLLLKEGLTVAVVEALHVSGGESGRTTAHLSNAFDDYYYIMEKLFGVQGSKTIAQSHTAAINLIETIILNENISCDFERVDGFLFAATAQDEKILDKEFFAAHRAGLIGVERLEQVPEKCLSSFSCLRFPQQGQFHAGKYLMQLAQIFITQKGQIYDNSRVIDIQTGPICCITTQQGHTIRSKHLFVATNTPINDKIVMHTKQTSARTYAIAASIPKESVAKGLYWDMEDPYHYIRLQRGTSETDLYDYLIIGGEDHRVGDRESGDEQFENLEKWARKHFPLIQSVKARWSGQIQEPVDHLAYIGKNPLDDNNVYIATGDSGNGMTHGTLTAILIRDLIMQRENPWSKLYEPTRKPHNFYSLKKFCTHLAEMRQGYIPYLTSSEVQNASQIVPNSGALIRCGLNKMAVYRDCQGKLHRCSAVCPHLQGLVSWNNCEKSWDCSCHGSRFDPFGRVLNGPSKTDLKQLD